jgi:pilus assembly protein CpaE
MMDSSLFIPRSTIASFAQSAEVVEALSNLKAHPLLSRAQYEAFTGTIDTIINKYPAGGTPELLIVQHDGPIEELERLAEVSAATTQLIVISHDNDIGRYRRLLDQGGADYLFTPVTPELLLGSISRTFARAENRKVGTLVTFFSCGGSSGSSAIAQNAAVLLSQLPEKRVMLLDFDIFTGTVALTFDLHPVRGLRELLRDPKSISSTEITKLAHERTAALQILCSPPALEPGFAMKADHFVDVLDQARSLVDFVVIDLAGGWSVLHSKLLAMSEHAMLVSYSDLGSFQVLHAIEELSSKLRQNLPPADIVLNRWTPGAEKLISSKLFVDAAKGGRLVRVGEFGQAAVTAAANSQVVAELQSRPEQLNELAAFLADATGMRKKTQEQTSVPLLQRIFGKRTG